MVPIVSGRLATDGRVAAFLDNGPNILPLPRHTDG